MSLNLSSQERLNLISNLGTMLGAGIPILDAVDSALKEAKGNPKKILEKLREDLKEGKTIAESFENSPDAFDPITVSLIKAAEESGTLDTTLKDLVISFKKEMEFSDKVKAALAYPGLVVVVFLGVLLLVLGYVIPRIAVVFSRLNVSLPLPTQVLIFFSNLLLQYTIYVAGAAILVIILAVYLYNTRRKELINFFYSFPLLSGLALEIDFARFTHSLSLLLGAGIPITESLELCRFVVNRRDVETLIKNCKVAVDAGKKLSDGFAEDKKHLIPETMMRITEAGEKSGTLEKSMQELSDYFETRVANALKNFTTLLEPILLVIIGIFVGGLMLSIVSPIYQLIGQIKGR
ncbi:MAG: type II secretion system F family protein [Microgenomates group bacterium]|jgi:type II secretory pathway component PulF